MIRLCGWCESLEHHRKYQRFVCFHSSAWIASLNVYWTLEMLQLQMYNYFPRNSSSAMIYWFFAFSLKMQMPGSFADIFRRFVNKALENLKWSSPTARTNHTFHAWGGWGLHEGEGRGWVLLIVARTGGGVPFFRLLVNEKREICHWGLWNDLKGLTEGFYGCKNLRNFPGLHMQQLKEIQSCKPDIWKGCDLSKWKVRVTFWAKNGI